MSGVPKKGRVTRDTGEYVSSSPSQVSMGGSKDDLGLEHAQKTLSSNPIEFGKELHRIDNILWNEVVVSEQRSPDSISDNVWKERFSCYPDNIGYLIQQVAGVKFDGDLLHSLVHHIASTSSATADYV